MDIGPREETTVNGVHFKLGDTIEYSVAAHPNRKLVGKIKFIQPGGKEAQVSEGDQKKYWCVDLSKVKRF